MKPSSPLALDLQWLRNHPETNYRVRRASDAECFELLEQTLRAAGVELTAGQCMPIDTLMWCVCVVRAGPDTLMRILCKKEPDTDETLLAGGFAALAVFFGGRMVIDKVRI